MHNVMFMAPYELSMYLLRQSEQAQVPYATLHRPCQTAKRKLWHDISLQSPSVEPTSLRRCIDLLIKV